MYKEILGLTFFDKRIKEIFNTLNDKKILILANKKFFNEYDKKYSIKKKLNIVDIVNIESNDTNIVYQNEANLEYDVILIFNIGHKNHITFTSKKLDGQNQNVVYFLEETIQDEQKCLYHILQRKTQRYFKYLRNKLRNKKIILYGAGKFLEIVNKYYDLSQLNIIGITDFKYYNHKENDEFLGYKIYSVEETKNLTFDYLLISTLEYDDLIRNLYYNVFRGKNINYEILVKKRLSAVIVEYVKFIFRLI